MTDTPHLSIGEFSSRARLSVRMLRHYDEHGLLRPAQVDPFTGYRRYSPDQLERAALIRRLRDVGFTVSAIAAVLASRGSDAYRQALLLQRDVLAAELRDSRDRFTLIEHLIRSEGDVMSDITVSRTTVPAMTVVALRGTIPTYTDEAELWGPFTAALTEQGITPLGPGGVIEHDTEYRERDVDESVWLPVAPGTTVSAPLVVHDLPARDVVLARVVGPYSLITEAHARIDEFARDAGVDLGGADLAHNGFNVYLTDCDDTSPEQNITDVAMVIA